MRFVGPDQYKRLLAAIDYYEKCGFKYINVPWAVGRDAILMTRPPSVKGEPFSYIVDNERSGKWLDARSGTRLYPVASAEQSFLQQQLDSITTGQRITGSFCAITPCFRNEPVVDDLHQPYFEKVELISWDHTTREDMDKMIAGSRLLFERDLWVDCVHNADPDPIGIVAYDLVTTHTGIELGSYGIREHPKVGRWVYGTGLAEPRYTYALEKEEPFNQKVEAFF
jgi:hypothetical protein